MSDQNEMFSFDKVPVLQNKVYRNVKEARLAPAGSISIEWNAEEGLVTNHDFDENIIDYDEEYDNAVPSKIFSRYYDEIATYLNEKYDLKDGIVYDIGCGNGRFIKQLVKQAENITGIGIDPAYRGETTCFDGRLSFDPKYFQVSDVKKWGKPSLVICRHTLEHIPSPKKFLQELFQNFAKNSYEKVPLFLEVPDLDWIKENLAFWDFCYEHVNYFDEKSLGNCIESAGAKVHKISRKFDGQYLWAEALINTDQEEKSLSTTESVPQSLRHGDDFQNSLKNIANKSKELSKVRRLVLWGMATKGIMYSLYLNKAGIDVSYCVDININKQNYYTPVLGKLILSPESLAKDIQYAIVCMNPIYAKEIMELCRELKIDALFYSPELDPITD